MGLLRSPRTGLTLSMFLVIPPALSALGKLGKQSWATVHEMPRYLKGAPWSSSSPTTLTKASGKGSPEEEHNQIQHVPTSAQEDQSSRDPTGAKTLGTGGGGADHSRERISR